MAMCLVWLSGEPGLLWRGIAFVMLFGYVVWQGYRYGVVPKLSELFNGLTQEQVEKRKIVAFAGASWAQHSWTNRQHILTRVSSAHPVLYVEPRVWLPRHVWRMRHFPRRIKDFFMQLVWFRRERGGLFIVSQANLIPGSRRWRIVARFNHVLNRWWLLLRVKALGFSDKRRRVMWIYDTEAAEYLPDFAGATVLYDCVDDHATQAGLDRNPDLVHREEKAIFAAADIVTVTSSRLFEMKQGKARRVELVLNAGDTRLYKEKENFDSLPIELQRIAKPIMGSVGALDAYKYDFELLVAVASAHHEWNFVFIGAPVVDNASRALRELQSLPNVHMLGAVDREDVPSYVYHFNVCLIPYQANSYNEASFPLKFWEFMATGLPIVVSGLPELKPYKDLIGYAHLRDEFGVLIARALEDPGDGMARRDLAAEHSWELRATRLLELLDSVPGV